MWKKKSYTFLANCFDIILQCLSTSISYFLSSSQHIFIISSDLSANLLQLFYLNLKFQRLLFSRASICFSNVKSFWKFTNFYLLILKNIIQLFYILYLIIQVPNILGASKSVGYFSLINGVLLPVSNFFFNEFIFGWPYSLKFLRH